MTATPAAAERHVNPWLTAIAVMFGTFMVVLDTTVVNVSLPQIAGSLGATVDEATWALTSYLVANAVDPAADRLAGHGLRPQAPAHLRGHRLHASPRCSAASRRRSPILILFRVLQGATGAVMQPLSQAVLLEAFEPQDRGKAMGFWGLGVVAAPILGPVLGGWLTDNYSWRWVFYINIPVGIAGVIMTRLFVLDPSYLKRRSAVVDYLGIGLLAIGISTLQVALDKGQQEDWFSSPLHRRDADRRDRGAGRLRVARADDRASGRRSARVQDPDLLARPGDHGGAGLRALRQPRAAAGHAADADGISAAAGRHRDGAARHGLVHRDAARRRR